MKITPILLMIIALLVSSTVKADIIYDTGLPNNQQWRNSDFSNQFGGQAADDFMLTADSVLTRVSWYGSYVFTPTQPMPDDFTINIYSDVADSPSSLIHTAMFAGSVARMSTGVIVHIPNQGDFEMYSYDVDISALYLSTNTKYWLSIVNRTSNMTQFGGWAWAYNQESNTHRWKQAGGDWQPFGSGNLAFTLRGETIDVPEPAALGLLGLGLASLCIAARRRKH